MPTQQQNPSSSGLAPVRISLMMLVLSPMAAMARTMKNLLRVFSGVKMSVEIPVAETMVVTTEIENEHREDLFEGKGIFRCF